MFENSRKKSKYTAIRVYTFLNKMQWQAITDSELFTSLINTCRKTVDKCSLSSNSPKSAKEFEGKLSLGDTYLLFQNTRERMVLQLESVKYQHSQYQIKTGVFSSGTVHILDFGEAVVSVLHGDNYQVLAGHLGAIIPRMQSLKEVVKKLFFISWEIVQ